jgi:hypothetical protein
MRGANRIRKGQQLFCSRACLTKPLSEKQAHKKATKARWVAENHERHLEGRRRWRERNKEKVREYKRREYEKNGARCNEQARQWRKDHPEEVRARSRATYKRHREKILARARQWQKNNYAHIQARNAAYYAKKPWLPMFYRTRQNCKRAGITCEFTEEWFRVRYQAGVCELSGLPFDLVTPRGPNSPSIDRIRAGGPYSPSNCRVILFSLNNALRDWGEDYLISVFEAVIAKRAKLAMGIAA